MKILFFIIILLFLFSLGLPFVVAVQKNIDVKVIVVGNNSSNNGGQGYIKSYFNSRVIDEASISENEINQSFNKGASEMFSFKAGDSWTFPLIFLIIIVFAWIIYEILHRTRKKKNLGKRRRFYT